MSTTTLYLVHHWGTTVTGVEDLVTSCTSTHSIKPWAGGHWAVIIKHAVPLS